MEKKYDHQIAEHQIQQLWHEKEVFTLSAQAVDARPLWSIDTPPPTVSGSLHIGHIFSYTHTDLIARYKRMQGYAVFYPIGFDDNGLPTERFVEKKQNVSALSVGRSAFIKRCLEETETVEKKFQELFKRMGLSIDWNHLYSTISADTRRISQQSFIELYRKKYIYRKNEPALYCTSCYTSVAQAELDDSEKETVMTTIPFTAADGSQLLIATTRPEFLGSCVALLYHPDDSRYTHLKGTLATVPLYDMQVPLLAEETVKPEKGTGLVMCCAFGDSSDVEWIKKHHLSYTQILQKDGRFTATLPIVGGLKVKPAREKILAELAAHNLIIEQKKVTHQVNIHERCKNEIEFLALPQWFIDISSHAATFKEKGNQVTWYPAFMKSRYDNWVDHINWDWCISRQRFFGIPFPCWHCTTCQAVILADIAQLPIDPQETPYGGACPTCKADTLVPDTDVMDTWNTSSLTPQICEELFHKAYGKEKKFLPMSMRPQAHDIIRTWAFDTIVKSWMHNQDIPWNDIVISGHVLSTEKQKISKSQGNSPLEPEQLLKTYPADVIRYWTAGAQLGTDTAFSENQLKIGQRLLVKLWNAFLFIKEHSASAATGVPQHTVLAGQGPTYILNRWIMHEATQAAAHYTAAFEDYQFHKALETAESFFWNHWCDNYIELVKDQFFHPEHYAPEEVAETREVLYHIGFALVQWYAPFLPFMTETIYQELYKAQHGLESIHQTRFIILETYAPEAVASAQVLLAAIQQVRKLKTDSALSLKTDLTTLTIHASEETQKLLKPVEKILAGAARAGTIAYSAEPAEPLLAQQDGIYQMVITL